MTFLVSFLLETYSIICIILHQKVLDDIHMMMGRMADYGEGGNIFVDFPVYFQAPFTPCLQNVNSNLEVRYVLIYFVRNLFHYFAITR